MDYQRRRGLQARSPDQEATDGVLSGVLGPQDAPAEWRPVAELLSVLRTLPATPPSSQAHAVGPGASEDPGIDRDRRTVQAMAAILAEAPAHRAWRRHWRVPYRPSVPRPLHVFRVRLATALVAAILAFMVGLASAGQLPGPAQNAISVALSKFGISVPRDEGQEGKENAVGPDATKAAKKGLCTAYFAGKGGENGGKLDSVAMRKLAEAAEGADNIEAYCAEFKPEAKATPARERPEHEGKANGKGHEKESADDESEDEDPAEVADQGSVHSSHDVEDHSAHRGSSED